MATQNPAQNEPQVENQTTSFETFVKKYQNIIFWTVLAILVIVFGTLAYQKWIAKPAQEEAAAQTFVAEQNFMAQDWETALNGDGNNLGFAQVIDQYGAKAGQAVYFEAGVCALQLGNNEDAIKYFGKYNGKDNIIKAKALCCTGDAYANLGENAKALDFFKKAAAVESNLYTAAYLLKAGIISEEMGDEAAALKFYEEIKTKYPQSMEAYEIDKYISRIQNK